MASNLPMIAQSGLVTLSHDLMAFPFLLIRSVYSLSVAAGPHVCKCCSGLRGGDWLVAFDDRQDLIAPAVEEPDCAEHARVQSSKNPLS